MDFKNLFKGKTSEETYPTTSKREIKKSDVKEFVVKVLIGGSWQIPSIGGIESRDSPIMIEEMEDIEQFEGIRCDMIGHDGRILGYYWKVSSKSKSKDPFGGLEELAESLEKFDTLKNRLSSALGGTQSNDEIKQALLFLIEKSEGKQESNDMLAEMDRVHIFMNKFESMKSMFGGSTDKSEYPMWLKALSDPTVMKGLNETVGGLARTVGQEMQVPPQNTITVQDKSQQSPSMQTPMNIDEFPQDGEEIVKVEEPQSMESSEKEIEVFEGEIAQGKVKEIIEKAPEPVTDEMKKKIKELPANVVKDGGV